MGHTRGQVTCSGPHRDMQGPLTRQTRSSQTSTNKGMSDTPWLREYSSMYPNPMNLSGLEQSQHNVKSRKHRISIMRDAKRPTPKHIIIKRPIVKVKERLLKEREKKVVTRSLPDGRGAVGEFVKG